MNLIKIVDTINNQSLMHSSSSGHYHSVVANNPLPSLLRPLLEYANQLRNSLVAYDALSLSLANQESILNYIADRIAVPDGTNPPEYVEVSDDEARVMMSGFVQAREALNAQSGVIGFTSNSGLLYNIMPKEHDNLLLAVNEEGYGVPVLYYDSVVQKWFARPSWPSVIAIPNAGDQYIVDNVRANTGRIAVTNGISPSGVDVHSIISQVAAKRSASNTGTIASAYRAVASQYTSDDMSNASIDECINAILDEATPSPSGIINDSAQEDIGVIANSIAVSATINQVTIEAIDSLSSSTFTKWINNKTTWVNDQHSAVKRVVKRLSIAFSQGGFKGVVSAIYDMIKAQSSIVNDEGIFKFTDNMSLIPKEYIAGVISQVFSTIAGALGVIVSIITPILRGIGSVLGSLVWGIVGSAKKDKSDTKASIPQSDIEDEGSFSVVPYAPFALCGGFISKVDWYSQFYEQCGCCGYFEVPGGAIFIGPGKSSDDYSSMTYTESTGYNWEFHPLAICLNPDVIANVMASEVDWVGESLDSNMDFMNFLSQEQCWKLWHSIMGDPDAQLLDAVNEESSGVLSDSHDALLRMSICFSICFFMQWVYSSGKPNTTESYGLHYPIPLGFFSLSAGSDDPLKTEKVKVLQAYGQLAAGISPSLFTNLPSWKDIITYCESTRERINYFPFQFTFGRFADRSGDRIDPSTLVTADFTSSCSDMWSELQELTDPYPGHFLSYGNAVPLPFSPTYSVNVPKYNASTFWKWIALSVVATAAVTAVIVVGAVKFMNWRTQARLKSIAKTSSDRDSYTNALQGTREVEDPETHQVKTESFDVNSPEGKEYISGCYKSYKQSVFRANLKANIIGGTRYDKTSMFGDADQSEKKSIIDVVKETSSSLIYDDDTPIDDSLATGTTQIDLSSVIKLIKG